MPQPRDTRLYRLLSRELIELWERIEPPLDRLSGEPLSLSRRQVTEIVLRRCAEVLERSGCVTNVKRLGDELIYREAQAPTAIGNGIAIPHVRSKNVKELVMCFLRYPEGAEMLSLDGEPVFLVFGIVTSYYESDVAYQRVYRKLLSILRDVPSVYDELMEVTDPGEVLRILRRWE